MKKHTKNPSQKNLNFRKLKNEVSTTLLIRISNFYLFSFALLSLISISIYVYGVNDLYSIWSFRIEDPPWIPPSFNATEIFGRHYFGDFQLPYYLAKDLNPYSWSFYNATMPFGLLIFRILNIFDVTIALLIFLIGSTLYFWKTLGDAFIRSKNDYKWHLATIFSLFSLPTLINIDRGGAQMLAYSLFVHGLVLIHFNRDVISRHGFTLRHSLYPIIAISLAISLKIYLVIPLILILGIPMYKTILKILLWTGISNFLISYLFGGPILALKGLYAGYVWQTGESDPGWIFGGVSLSKFIAAIYFYTHNQSQTDEFAAIFQNFVFAPGVIYLALVAIVIFKLRGREDINYRIALALTTIFLITPVSHSYTLVACSFVAIFSLRALLDATEQVSQWRAAMLLFTACLSLLPIPSEYYLTFIPAFWVLHMGLLLLLDTFFKQYVKLYRR